MCTHITSLDVIVLVLDFSCVYNISMVFNVHTKKQRSKAMVIKSELVNAMLVMTKKRLEDMAYEESLQGPPWDKYHPALFFHHASEESFDSPYWQFVVENVSGAPTLVANVGVEGALNDPEDMPPLTWVITPVEVALFINDYGDRSDPIRLYSFPL